MPRFTVNYEDNYDQRPPSYQQPPPPQQQEQSGGTITIPVVVAALIAVPLFWGMGRPVIFAPTSAPPVNIINNSTR